MITTDVWKDGRIVTSIIIKCQRCFRLKNRSWGDFNYMADWRLSKISDDDTTFGEGRNLKITS